MSAPSIWVIVMLADHAAGVPVAELRASLQRNLPAATNIVFPAQTQNGGLAWEHAMANYAFVRAPLGEPVNRLEWSKYVELVVRAAGGRGYEQLDDAEVEAILRTARPPLMRKGTRVKITMGDWAGLSGRLVRRRANSAEVEIQLHSRRITVRASLHELERE